MMYRKILNVLSITLFCTAQGVPSKIASWKPGVEILHTQKLASLFKQPLSSIRFGFVTNHTGKTLEKKRSIDLLLKKGFTFQAIFVPEHGLDGKIHAEKKVDHSVDSITNIPIISLYKGNGPKEINADDMNKVDALIFDMQDTGMRHYTYISTLYKVLNAAASFDKPLIILDRPNPLGAIMEGPLVDPEVQSFISIAPIPLRHGMTLGELALYFNRYLLAKPAQLTIIPVAHYERNKGINKVWLAPLSPNIPSAASCYGYSILGLLSEIGPFDMAIGTPKAFQCLLLPESLHFPKKKWIALSLALEKHGINTQAYRYYHEKKKKWFHGLRFLITDINKVSTMKTVFLITDFFQKEGITFSYRNIDKAIGTKKFRGYLDHAITKKDLFKEINTNLETFNKQAFSVYLYKPTPCLIKL